ncbi:hypothetical protein BGZ59_005227 [Podila verticillata]|nr:hypothetical protein BGZ59_005227 [Podila verticillata]
MSFVPIKLETDIDIVNSSFHFNNFPLPQQQQQQQQPSPPEPYMSHASLAPNHLYHTSEESFSLTIDTQASYPQTSSSEDLLQHLDLFSNLQVELSASELQAQLLHDFDPLTAPLNLGPNSFPGCVFNGISHGSSSSCASPSPSSSSLYSPSLSSASSPVSPYFDEGIIPVVACASCKRSHIKCDRGRPCQNCQKHPYKAATCRDADPKPRGRPKGGSKAAAEAIMIARQHQMENQVRSGSSTSTPPYATHQPNPSIARRASYSAVRSGWHPYVSTPSESSSSRFASRSLSSSMANRQRRPDMSSPTEDTFACLQRPFGIPVEQVLNPSLDGCHEAPMSRSLSDGSRVQRPDHHFPQQEYSVCPPHDNETMATLLRQQQEQQFELHLQQQSQQQQQQEEFRRQQEFVRKSLTRPL